MLNVNLLELSLNNETRTGNSSSSEVEKEAGRSQKGSCSESETESSWETITSSSEEAEISTYQETRAGEVPKANIAREHIKIIGNGKQFAANGSDSEYGIVFQESGDGFACFKSKNISEIDYESINGFVFPPKICKLPRVVIRVASVPYLAIKDLKYSNNEEIAAFEEIFKWPKGVALVAAITISPCGMPPNSIETMEGVYKCLPNSNSYQACTCINKTNKWSENGSNEIGVVLIGGDAAYACFCREDSEAVKSWEFWYKRWLEKEWGKCAEMLRLRVSKDSNPYSAGFQRFFKLLYPNVSTYTVKYPDASIEYFRNHESENSTCGAALLLGFKKLPR